MVGIIDGKKMSKHIQILITNSLTIPIKEDINDEWYALAKGYILTDTMKLTDAMHMIKVMLN